VSLSEPCGTCDGAGCPVCRPEPEPACLDCGKTPCGCKGEEPTPFALAGGERDHLPAHSKLDRHAIRYLAHRFRLTHSPLCRKANNVGAPKGEGRFPFKCECTFFQDVKDAAAGKLLVCRKAVCSNRSRRLESGDLPLEWVPSVGSPSEHYCSSACLDEIEPGARAWSMCRVCSERAPKAVGSDICVECEAAYAQEAERLVAQGEDSPEERDERE
jgi:hypothetical protein